MPRLKKRGKEQIIRQYYGINPKTFKVECVSETRSGRLSVWTNGTSLTHPLAGRDGRKECVVAFDLSDIEEVAMITGATGEHERSIIEKLEAKAAQVKREAEKKT
jgi:hypothetical protein